MDFEPDHVEPGHFDEEYYRNNGQLGDRPALRYYTRLVKRYVGAGPYLDFGCGTGYLVRHLAGVGPASGFEISQYSAAIGRKTAPGSTFYTDVADLPDASFGGLTAIHVLEHLADDVADQALATFRRVLKPAGRALVVMPDPAGRARRLTQEKWNGFTDPTHINLKPHAQWREFIEARGFRVVREGSDGMWNVPYRKLPKLVDAGLHAGPALVQFLSGRLFLREGSGESMIFVLEKN
ncbi:MAG: class SAM-dependent methyltransferase [Pseudonocardiales bacterium]|nr:class SAM-dependent methyltransferase [Pseudonocardiales bacterium]